jgi:hypothetical protein
MVERIPDRSEATACCEFSALLSHHSERVGEYKGLPIWKCGVNQRPNAIGYWIGNLPEFYSFLVVEPITLGGVSVLEAVRGWSDPERRGHGLFSTLLRTATREGVSLVSDRDGMTESAHTAWIRASGFSRKYFDTKENQMAEIESVPPEDRFTHWAQGKRWLLVLNPNM